MAKYAISSAASVVLTIVIVTMIIAGGKNFKFANAGEEPPSPTETTCIAHPAAKPEDLSARVQGICKTPDDCPLIKEGGECFSPNTIYNHASAVYNDNFTKSGVCDGLIIYGLLDYYNVNEDVFCQYEQRQGVDPYTKYFCVPKPNTSDEELIANIEYGCSKLGDCSMIKPNGSCFMPDTLLFHAAVVMNKHYAVVDGRRHFQACSFSGSGVYSLTDPSSGSCVFD